MAEALINLLLTPSCMVWSKMVALALPSEDDLRSDPFITRQFGDFL